MKILGIVVEYNPFHTGHVYHIQKAKELVKPDVAIAIMSGNYVQRGEVAIIDKFKRSELAIKYGVDLVVELPFVFVSQSADYFCFGAIDLLAKIGITDLVFGSECGDINTFIEIAKTIKDNPTQYESYIQEAMNQGYRYPDACNQALSKLLNKSIITPNDLLGLGYVKEVINHNYPINLYCIKRSNDYHETKLSKVASATALRKALFNHEEVSDYLLDTSYYDKLYQQEDFFNYLKYQIIIQDINSLKNIHLVDEGIENLLKKVIYQANSYQELVQLLTSKRYTKTRIQRMLLHILMQNTKEEIKKCLNVDYLRILQMNDKGQAYLKKIKKDCKYQIITKLSSGNHPALALEIKTSRVLSLLNKDIVDQEYKHIPKRTSN